MPPPMLTTELGLVSCLVRLLLLSQVLLLSEMLVRSVPGLCFDNHTREE